MLLLILSALLLFAILGVMAWKIIAWRLSDGNRHQLIKLLRESRPATAGYAEDVEEFAAWEWRMILKGHQFEKVFMMVHAGRTARRYC